MFTSTDGKSYYVYDDELYPIKDFSDTSTDYQLIYLIVPFWLKLFMSLRIAFNYLRLSLRNYSIDIKDKSE